MEPRSWFKKVDDITYLISTDPDLADLDFIDTAFASEDMSWAKPLSLESMKTMLANSCTLSLYILTSPPSNSYIFSSPNSFPTIPLQESSEIPGHARYHKPAKDDVKQIGLARLITDYVTFVYMTDVYLHPSHRHSGLGKWLIKCTKEVMDGIPTLRRAMLITSSPEIGVPFYGRALGMLGFEQSTEKIVIMSTPTRH